MPHGRDAGGMMGRLAAMVLLAALLAPAVAAGPLGFSGQATPCHPLHTMDVRPEGLCLRVRQQGTLLPGPCEADACQLTLSVLAEANGVPLLRKTLTTDVTLDGFVQGAPLCAAESSDVAVSCQAEDVLVALALAEGTCQELRVRTTLQEAADVPPTLPIRAENGWRACRVGGALLVQ